MRATIFLSLTLLCGTTYASTLYNINFAKDNGAGPDETGSFTYDPVAGFSTFVVIWDGISFDLTASANLPTLGAGNTHCPGRASNAAYGFFMLQQLTKGCDAGTYYYWNGNEFGTSAAFDFGQNISGDSILKTANIPGYGIGNSGTFSLTPVSSTSTTPEPASLVLFGSGLSALLFSRRRKRSSLPAS